MIRSGSPSKAAIKASHDANWFSLQRLMFIENRLFWSGRVNRSDVARAFGINLAAVSKDFTTYQRLAPRNVIYDKSAKTYRASSKFQPRLVTPSLDHLLAHAILRDQAPSAAPIFEWVQPPLRHADPVIVRNLIEAAGERLAVKVFYKSMSTPEGRWRWIEPHNIIFDGQRWHCRAWCAETEEYRDFLLGRIVAAEDFRPASGGEPAFDTAWSAIVEVVIRPHHKLSLPQAELIAGEYGMADGQLRLPCRQALLGYLLIGLGLDRDLGPPRQTIELVDDNVREKALWLA